MIAIFSEICDDLIKELREMNFTSVYNLYENKSKMARQTHRLNLRYKIEIETFAHSHNSSA